MGNSDRFPPIEHVVVLMLENRSFDHLLGFFPGAEGLKGTEFNLLKPFAEESDDNPRFGVGKNAPWRLLQVEGEGPAHSLNATNIQLSGRKGGPTSADPALCNGFILSYSSTLHTDHVANPSAEALRLPLQAFTPDRLPAINALASEFVLCDHWFCEVPGPTQPNRLFAHAATSAGFAHNVWSHVFDFRSIYNSLQEAGKTWAVYFSDDNEVAKFSQIVAKAYTEPGEEAEWEKDKAAGAPGGFFDFKNFFARHAAAGTLPNYSFVVPNFGDGGGPEEEVNSMHPPHDVRPGDRLVADVYEALRGNGSEWPKTLLVVTFDEHGGFFDHVVPPAAPNPDGLTSPPEGDASFAPAFAFDRLGLRVPTILVSAWLPRGRIDSTPYQHTSIAASLKELFGLDAFLTRRDASATSFLKLLTELPAARSDTPTTLPRPAEDPVGLEATLADDADQPPDELLGGMLEGWFQIAQTIPDGLESVAPLPQTNRDAHAFIRDQVKRYCNYRAATQPQYRIKPRDGGFGWELSTADGPVLAASPAAFASRDEALRAVREMKLHSRHAAIIA